jgi:hypothetical protein
VNWYLHHYVKCDTPTPDRYNWRFSTSSRNGGGFRPGIIFIKPNWRAILDAAKFLTKLCVVDWFGSASLVGIRVDMANTVIINGHDILWLKGFLPQFIHSLRLQGATDELAFAWTRSVYAALEEFSFSIHDVVPILPPPNAPHDFDSVPAPFVLAPWHLVAKAKQSGSAAFVNSMIQEGISLSSAPARVAIEEFARWWDTLMGAVRLAVQANEVTGRGTWRSSSGTWTGVVSARNGFLTRLHVSQL